MLNRRHGRRDAADDAQWAEVSTRLDTLQTEVAKVTATLTEDRRALSPPWLPAIALLGSSVLIVLVGILFTIRVGQSPPIDLKQVAGTVVLAFGSALAGAVMDADPVAHVLLAARFGRRGASPDDDTYTGRAVEEP
jgi:hypothetical protein